MAYLQVQGLNSKSKSTNNHNTMLTALIIDDEEKGRLVLSQKLSDHCSDVKVIGNADGGERGRAMIESFRPDIVFLDIEMPGVNGFEMLNSLSEKNFHLIFTTAYDQYALKAIKFAAFDYLLKPIDIDELKFCVEKISKEKSKSISNQLDILIQNTKKNASSFKRIAIPTNDGISYFNVDELIYLEADSNYTRLYFTYDRKILASKTMKDFEEQLSDASFIRVHHTFIVNVQHITKYIKGDGGQVLLSNGKVIDVSRRKKADLLNMIG